jgi:preprotein translocase subunit SecB
MTASLTEEPGGSHNLELEALYLEKCSVERASTKSQSAGEVEGTVEVQPEVSETAATYRVIGTYKFTNEDGEDLAVVSMTYAAIYTGDAVTSFDESRIQDFSRSVVVHATPFMREFLATMMNRLALPQFLLPLVRKADLIGDDDEAEEGARD